jgi:hypothetical protein
VRGYGGQELTRHAERADGFTGFGAERGARESLRKGGDPPLVDVGIPAEETLERADPQRPSVGVAFRGPVGFTHGTPPGRSGTRLA